MASWQYPIHLLPEEEIDSYFGTHVQIGEDAFNEIDWWKYRQIDLNEFEVFEPLLSKNKSWSERIILFGEESTDCIELLFLKNRMVEISVRIDFRKDYKALIKILCEFAEKHKCVFLNGDLNIIQPNKDALSLAINIFASSVNLFFNR